MKTVSLKIVLVPIGISLTPRRREFDLETFILSNVLRTIESISEPFNIEIYENNIKLEEAVLGVETEEKKRNLKIFLQNYAKTNKILSKDEQDFKRTLKK